MISSYAVDKITIVKWNGNDQWGEPIATTNINVRGYIDWKTKMVKTILGQEVQTTVAAISPVFVYLQMKKTDKALGRALRHEDRIIVDGMERAILTIGEPKSFSCPH